MDEISCPVVEIVQFGSLLEYRTDVIGRKNKFREYSSISGFSKYYSAHLYEIASASKRPNLQYLLKPVSGRGKVMNHQQVEAR